MAQANRDTLLSDYFERTYRKCNLIGCSPRTIKAYRTELGNVQAYACSPAAAECKSEFAGKEICVADLSDDLLSEAMDWQIQRGRSKPTANKLHTHITALWRDAFERGIVEAYPRCKKIKEPVRLVRTWQDEELARMLEVARGLPDSAATCRRLVPNPGGKRKTRECGWAGRIGAKCRCGGEFTRPFTYQSSGLEPAAWWHALLLTNYYTGLRITPLMLLECGHVDLSRSEIFVSAETTKQKRDLVFDGLPTDLIAALQAINPVDRQYLFPWHLDRHVDGRYLGNWKALNRHLRKILRAAGLPDTSKHLFHCIRRKTATEAKRSGGIEAARQLLDHSTRRVTDSYVDPTQAPERVRLADLMPAPIRLWKPGEAG